MAGCSQKRKVVHCFHLSTPYCVLLSSLSALTVIQPLHKHIPFTNLVENYPFTLNKKKVSKSVKGGRNGRGETATLSYEISFYLFFFFFLSLMKIFFYKFLKRTGKLFPTECNAQFLFLTL